MAFDPLLISPHSKPALADVVAKMLADLKLKADLPPAGGGLPPPALVLVRMAEKPVGVGDLRGNATEGPLPLISLKGGRLAALTRFELWAADAGAADAAVTQLRTNLLDARAELRTLGFLKLDPAEVSSAERFPSGIAGSIWRQSASYELLYEYHYRETSGAESLIHRIPIHADPEETPSPDRETTVVTGPTVRWDDEAAAALRLRGPDRVRRLSLLAYVPGAVPTGKVVLRRTYDGAPGPPAVPPNPAGFLAAAAAETPVDVRFELSLANFLNAFDPPGGTAELGDWETDAAPDVYELRRLELPAAIVLPRSSDRFHVSYEPAPLDRVAVIYLRTERI